MSEKSRIIVAIGGASGCIYGIKLLETLKNTPKVETHLVLSKTARMTIPLETNYSVDDVYALADIVHNNNNVGATIASGSFKSQAMIVTACSMKNLSGIVHSFAEDLLTRAADVMLKERRQLILMPRETPLHAGHLEMMLKAAQLGAVIAPPMPAFYTAPETIDDITDHTVGRILDLINIDSQTVKRWEGIQAEYKSR